MSSSSCKEGESMVSHDGLCTGRNEQMARLNQRLQDAPNLRTSHVEVFDDKPVSRANSAGQRTFNPLELSRIFGSYIASQEVLSVECFSDMDSSELSLDFGRHMCDQGSFSRAGRTEQKNGLFVSNRESQGLQVVAGSRRDDES